MQDRNTHASSMVLLQHIAPWKYFGISASCISARLPRRTVVVEVSVYDMCQIYMT